MNKFLNGVEVTNGVTKLNGVSYTWPGSDGNANKAIMSNGSGALSWLEVFKRGGNSFGADSIIGLGDAFALIFNINGSEVGRIGSSGTWAFGASGTVNTAFTAALKATSPIGGLIISGTAQGTTSGGGDAPGPVLSVTGTKGRDSSTTTTSLGGGSGADIQFTTGSAGSSTGITGATVSGNAGQFLFSSGRGGDNASVSGTAGDGGILLVTLGAGGDATTATGVNHAGNGGYISLSAGSGGSSNSGSGANGSGGNVYILGGAKGGTGANDGNIMLAYNRFLSAALGSVGVRKVPGITGLDVAGTIRTDTGIVTAAGQTLQASGTLDHLYGPAGRTDAGIALRNNAGGVLGYLYGEATGFGLYDGSDAVAIHVDGSPNSAATGVTVNRRLTASGGVAGLLLGDIPTISATVLNYDSTGSNIENGTTYPTSPVVVNGWQNVGPSQSFTSAGTGFIYEIALSGFGFFVNGAYAEFGSRLLMDGTTGLSFGGDASSSGTGGNIFSGAASFYVTGLSAGSHTLQAQMFSSQGGPLYIRGSQEWMRITVREYRK